jgi:hypothetical protein
VIAVGIAAILIYRTYSTGNVVGFVTSNILGITSSSLLPNPAIISYSYADSSYDYYARIGLFTHSNVIVGKTTNAELVKNLRRSGKLFAYHISHSPDVAAEMLEVKQCISGNVNDCAKRLANIMTAPFTNTLGGTLPEGFDAIAYDEIGCINANYPIRGEVMVETLKKVRQAIDEQHGGKKVFLVYGTISCAFTGPLYDNTHTNNVLDAVNKYADAFLAEWYLSENQVVENSLHLDSEFANLFTFLEGKSKGLSDKTIMTIAVSNRPKDGFDNNPAVNFKQFLNAQVKAVKTAQAKYRLKGIGFYPNYGMEPDNQLWLNTLMRHYFLVGNVNSYGSGKYQMTEFVKNASFENGLSNWWFNQSSAGNCRGCQIAVQNYTDNQLAVLHGAKTKFPSGTKALIMVRGSQGNRLVQAVNVKPNTDYKLSAYTMNVSRPSVAPGAKITIRGNGSTTLRPLSAVLPIPFYIGSNRYVTYKLFIEYNSKDSTSISLGLDDNAAVFGDKTLWDFIDLEETYGIPVIQSFRAN